MSNLLIDILDLSGVELPDNWKTSKQSMDFLTTKPTNQMTIKQIKKELGINNADIAKAFGYVNANSYATSTAKPRLQKGIEWLYETIKSNEK
jgi:YesN/AraC family two-component response regulator